MANYDDWKATEPDYMKDDTWDAQFDAWDRKDYNDDPMDAYEYPQDDPSNTPPWDSFEDVEYKERVVNDLLNAMDEFLVFSNVRELLKVIVGNL